MTELVYAIPPAIGLILIWFGLQFKDYMMGVFGGLTIFLYGITILLNPIPSLQGLTNLFLGSVCFGLGGYIFIRGSLEEFSERF